MENKKPSSKLSFEELLKIVKQKIDNKEEGSYSHSLALGGVEKITRKIGEEAFEVVIAAFVDEKNNDEKSRQELIGELCDLFFHSLILMATKDINFEQILQEFSKRNSKKK